ncbi:MAG TPA: histidine kinase, partial [Chromatiaceae bacterium]|nr:histidine kinase [Chromatiaceae bacterium]
DPKVNLYYWLLWGRRLLIGLIILAGYSFYAFLEHSAGLVQLGLISFVAVAQFLPGIVGLLYWRRATRDGFIAGLLSGILIWILTLLVPMLENSGFLSSGYSLEPWQKATGLDHWGFATFCSLSLNALLFTLVSLLTPQRPDEAAAAQSCCTTTFVPLSGVVAARSPAEFKQELAELLGRTTADQEVDRALSDLEMSPAESRPAELRRLRERIERNLYGLIGPQMSHLIVNRKLALDAEARTALADSMRYVEERLARSRSLLDGLARELDNLRRYQKQILEDLPLGACALGQVGEIILWNQAMEHCTGTQGDRAIGYPLNGLPPPWNDLLAGFAKAGDNHLYHIRVETTQGPRWLSLHKAVVGDTRIASNAEAPGMVILVEDLTQLEALEAELAHSDRLASIGRLAAGLAHEIGNPLTGIASIAQNLKYEEEPGAIEEGIEEILNQTRRISHIVQSLMNFSRGGTLPTEHAAVDLGRVLREALELTKLTHKQKHLEFRLECPEKIIINGDSQRLSQVFVNLFSNACDASGDGDLVEAEIRKDERFVEIRIRDQGSGIPAAFRERLFEPFATTKPAGEGTGLGLSL